MSQDGDRVLSTVDRLRAELAALEREIPIIERLADLDARGRPTISYRNVLRRLRAQRHDVLVNLAAWQDAALASDEE